MDGRGRSPEERRPQEEDLQAVTESIGVEFEQGPIEPGEDEIVLLVKSSDGSQDTSEDSEGQS